MALASCLLSGCAGESEAARPTVIASFYPLAEIAERVGGDRIDVSNLTPAGTEPHDLELTTDQVDSLLDADVVLYLGRDFQPAIEEVVGARSDGSVEILSALGGGDAADAGDDDEPDDPHFWLDPTLMSAAAEIVAEALGDADPDGASVYARNAEAYRDELAELDAEMETGLASCARNEIVTAHRAFSHLTDRYGLEELSVSGISPEAEPDAQQLDDLAEEIEERGVTTVFTEPLVPDDVAETLARESGATVAVLDPIEGLSADALDSGATYASVMRANLAALREALDCA